jgi:tetratricopeptide (TPR) repeat protein
VTDLTSRLEIEALRQSTSGARARTVALILTIVPFAAALALLWFIGAEVRAKQADLSSKEAELQARGNELKRVEVKIADAEAKLKQTTAELEGSRAQAAAAQSTVAQVASVLTDPASGNAQQRVEQATAALGKNTPLVRAQELWNKGHAAYQRHDMTAAKQLFLDAKLADGGYAPPYNSLGNIEFQAGRPADAIPWYLEAVKRSPSYAPAHFNLALAYYQLRRLDEARASLKEALRLRPRYPEAEKLGAAIELRAGKAAKAP